MVSFEQQLHTLSRHCALRITKMLTAKHSFSITEIYGDLSKNSTETKQRCLYEMNEWGPESPKDNMPWGAKQFAGIYDDDEKKPDNLTPEQSGMSKGRCPI